MKKQVNWLYCRGQHTNYSGTHVSRSLRNRIGIDNPRRGGFKVLVIHTSTADYEIVSFAMLDRHYAAPNGMWLKGGECGKAVTIHNLKPDVPFSEKDLQKATHVYSKFVRSLTWRNDKLVIPFGLAAVDLLYDMNQRVGFELNEVKSLDELTEFESRTDKLMIDQSPYLLKSKATGDLELLPSLKKQA